MRTRLLNRLYDSLIVGIVVAFFLLMPFQIIVYDDAYVYFTYARNFVEGRPFAYDPRNIPSEGFTSLLYMLMLVPAELLRVNPILAGALINMTALALAIVALGQAARATGVFSDRAATLFMLILSALLLQDYNVRSLVLSGFEAVLGALSATSIVVSAAHALDERRAAHVRRHWLSAFFMAVFLAHLVRPEYLLIGALSGAALLWLSSERAALLRRTAIFALVMAGYYLFKLAIFGDLLPTGFYRKVRTSALGLDYVSAWLNDYQSVLPLAAIASIVLSVALRKRALWLLILAGGALSILLFYTRTAPLSAVWHRFLVVPIWTSYALCAAGAAWLIERVAHFVKNRPAQLAEVGRLAAFCLALPWIVSNSGLTPLEIERAVREHGIITLPERAERALRENLYLQLGTYWRARLSDPTTITVAYNEVGALPYALGSRLVDLYGLAEPAIAHLFSMADGEAKTAQYIQHVLAQQPDVLLMLNYGAQEQAVWHGFPDPHSPFHSAPPAAIYEAYRAYGMAYACSINHWGLKLHVLLRLDALGSAAQLDAAFCSHPSAYRFVEGLTIETEGRAVHFPPLAEALVAQP
jgi:hypothetical protein